MGVACDFPPLNRLRPEEAGLAGLFRQIVDAAPVAMVVSDPHGRIAYVNAAAALLFGYAFEELAGKALEALVPERFRAHHPGLRDAFAATPSARPMGAGRELYGLRQNGTEVPVEIALNPIPTAGGSYVVAAIVDITDRKRAEELRIASAAVHERNEQLAALNEELQSFSYSVSHDLRAPIRAVAGYVQAIGEDYDDRLDDEGRRMLAIVAGEASRMDNLIDAMLDFVRLARGPLEDEPVEMSALARDVGRKLNRAGTVDLQVADLPMIRGDAELLRLVWEHVIANAIKFSHTSKAPAIRITGRVVGAEAEFEVSDNGVGFDQRYADKLFGLFQRLHRADEFPGAGIGLASVGRIIARHRGRVWANGEIGRGARVGFALPLQVPAALPGP